MKKILLFVAVFFSALFLLTSCLDSDDDYEYTDDTAITAFSLGNMKRKFHTTSSLGADSTYTRTFSGSTYDFYIDHIKGQIYNPDSLPYGVDAAHVLATISSLNSGTILLKSMNSDTLSYYSSSDSIDFSKPREIQVYSNSGKAFRKYAVCVNVHQEDSDVFSWHKVAADVPVASLNGMKAHALAGNLVVLGYDGTNTVTYTMNTSTLAWTKQSYAWAADAYKNFVANSTKAYVLSEGTLYGTTTGESWNTVATNQTQLKQLVGASTAKLYAIATDGSLVTSADEGATWTTEQLDDDIALMPTRDINFWCLPSITNESTNRLLIIGNRDANAYASDSTAFVWGKVEENVSKTANLPWAYYDIAEDNHYKAPRLANMQVTAYDAAVIAIGGAGLGASTKTAFDNLYRSSDCGITWQKDTVINIPTGFSSSATSFAITSDSNSYLWIICGNSGQVWKGRTNRLGWKKEEKYIKE